jgi:hypothetical protein
VEAPVRGRHAVLAAIAAGTVMAGGIALPAAPAAAAPSGPTLDCIVRSGGTYRAVFGYDNDTPDTLTVETGPDNTMSPDSLDGIQTTTFAPGHHRAAFATPPIKVNTDVSWTVLGTTVTATFKSAHCGPEVTLPAEGNGIGPVVVLGGSVLLSLGSLYLRQRRQIRQQRRRAA